MNEVTEGSSLKYEGHFHLVIGLINMTSSNYLKSVENRGKYGPRLNDPIKKIINRVNQWFKKAIESDYMKVDANYETINGLANRLTVLREELTATNAQTFVESSLDEMIVSIDNLRITDDESDSEDENDGDDDVNCFSDDLN